VRLVFGRLGHGWVQSLKSGHDFPQVNLGLASHFLGREGKGREGQEEEKRYIHL
jgi:hypothetical protein